MRLASHGIRAALGITAAFFFQSGLCIEPTQHPCPADFAQIRVTPMRDRTEALEMLASEIQGNPGWRKKLDRVMANRMETLENSRIPHSTVQQVLAPVDTQQGMNSRVIQVSAPSGTRLALKLHYAYRPDHLSVSYALQKYLGGIGIAPKLVGVLEKEEIAGLVKRFPDLAKLPARFFEEYPFAGDPAQPFEHGLLMELIPNAWNEKALELDRGAPIPSSIRRMNFSRAERQVRALNLILDRLGILSSDPQFLIDRNADVYLIDFDGFTYLDTQGRIWQHEGVQGPSRDLEKSLKTRKNHLSLDRLAGRLGLRGGL